MSHLYTMNQKEFENHMRNSSCFIAPPTLLCDFYKVSHRQAYPKNTTKIYSTLTPRSNKYMPMATGAVVFGIQSFIMKYLIEYFNKQFFGRPKEDVVAEYERYMKYSLFIENPDSLHIADLHDLGYLPIEIRALKEGTVAPMQVPVLTIENTHDDFFWLTNYFETIMSNEIWLPMTSATFAYEMRKMLDGFAIKTTGSKYGVEFQCHDFSMRGMSSLESAMASGAGHLLSFVGTDTIPAIAFLEHYYGANIEKEIVGTSINATEHSVMTALTPTDGSRDEYDAYKHLITEVFPNGFVSLVSDSYDFWKVIEETIPSLKNEIMARDGRVVIRPDSGNPADVLCGRINYDIDLTEENETEKMSDLEGYIYEVASDWAKADCEGRHNCGNDTYDVRFKLGDKIYSVEVGFSYNRHDKTYYYIERFGYKSEGVQWDKLKELEVTAEDKGLVECLWDTFGGTVSEQGYKVLDSHIGAIYGDSITYDLAKEICERLEAKGFASTNVVFGVGSYSYQGRTRDSLGWAIKATFAEIDGEPVMLMKDPKTDSSKKSQRGKVLVKESENGGLIMIDGFGNTSQDAEALENSMLEVVYRDGKLFRIQSLVEIRGILSK
ncbi:nicotinate phosphoribosyltransferase [Lysinibacillus xylanilyticus]|uniref:nicotinate phosphoribosyltransferase n=1 Tax=Lysinibacillus xylanilyticus TaxID=582475 RepID=UPI0038091ED5